MADAFCCVDKRDRKNKNFITNTMVPCPATLIIVLSLNTHLINRTYD